MEIDGIKYYYLGEEGFSAYTNEIKPGNTEAKFYLMYDTKNNIKKCVAIRNGKTCDVNDITGILSYFGYLAENEQEIPDLTSLKEKIESLKEENELLKEQNNLLKSKTKLLQEFFNGIESTVNEEACDGDDFGLDIDLLLENLKK